VFASLEALDSVRVLFVSIFICDVPP
jgi:hypothetical protein